MRVWDLDNQIDLLQREYVNSKTSRPVEIIDGLVDLYVKVFGKGPNNSITSFVKQLTSTNSDFKGTAILPMFLEDLLRAAHLRIPFSVGNYLLLTGEAPNKPIRVNMPTELTGATLADEVFSLINTLGVEDTILVLKILIVNIGR